MITSQVDEDLLDKLFRETLGSAWETRAAKENFTA
jgi:hypothetical protein